ncbi:signal peptidase I [Bacillus testis]|uniref:signal peptidase I n=1 Tax=Bacillus testis TaxID=1622072 RepID=UPI00067F53DE|nr:signal peptidase I [Bacillus testis]
MRVVGKIVSSFIGVLFVLILVFALFLFTSNKMHPGSIPTLFGYKMMTVLSGSMRPEFNPGDIVIAKDVNPTELKKGDIITFIRKDKKYVTHRIIDVKKESSGLYYTTKGDANNTQDPELTFEKNVRGIYLVHIPYLGMIINKLSGIYGFLLLVVMPIILLVGIEIKEKITKNKKGKNSYRPRDIEA